MATFKSTIVDKNSEKGKEFGNSMYRASSPFIDGVKFQITDYTYSNLEVDGVDRGMKAVFLTTIGEMQLNMLFSKKIDCHENIITPKGTFIDAATKTVSGNKTYNQLMSEIVALCSGKDLIIHRRDYVAKDSNGRLYPQQVVDIDFA